MTLLILLALLVVAIGIASARRRPAPSASRPPLLIAPPIDLDEEEESAADFALREPIEALLRHGTPEDAARLSDQGVDLTALGYRPPGES